MLGIDSQPFGFPVPCFGFRVSSVRVSGFGFRVSCFRVPGFGVFGSDFRGLRFRVPGVPGSEFQDFGLRPGRVQKGSWFRGFRISGLKFEQFGLSDFGFRSSGTYLEEGEEAFGHKLLYEYP